MTSKFRKKITKNLEKNIPMGYRIRHFVALLNLTGLKLQKLLNLRFSYSPYIKSILFVKFQFFCFPGMFHPLWQKFEWPKLYFGMSPNILNSFFCGPPPPLKNSIGYRIFVSLILGVHCGPDRNSDIVVGDRKAIQLIFDTGS